MAISPPSDIVLDVAKAADPVKLQAAAEKLARIAAKGNTAPDFAGVLAAARASEGTATPAAVPGGLSPQATLANLQRPSAHSVRQAAEAPSPQMKAFQGLEAVFLQTYVETMLPHNEGFFGDAAAGNITKTFLAQQLATQLAKSGSIGLAKSLFAAHAPAGAAAALAAGGAARQAQSVAVSTAAGNVGTLTGLMAGSRLPSRRT